MTNFTFVGLSENLTSSYDCLSYNAWSNAFYVTDGSEALQFHSSFPALYGDRISIVLPDAWGLRRQPIFGILGMFIARLLLTLDYNVGIVFETQGLASVQVSFLMYM